MTLLYIFAVVYFTTCTADCPPGYAGPNCKTECTDTCYKRFCTLTLEGGINCTNGCKDGYFGEPCTMECDKKCKKCDRLERHKCVDCWGDLSGPRCDNKTIEPPTPSTLVIVLGAFIVFSVLCIVVISLLVYRNHKRKMHRDLSSGENSLATVVRRKETALPAVPDKRETPPEYCEIPDEACPSEKSYFMEPDANTPRERPPKCVGKTLLSESLPSARTEMNLVETDIELHHIATVKTINDSPVEGNVKFTSPVDGDDVVSPGEHIFINTLYEPIGVN